MKAPHCPICAGEGVLLGALGLRRYFRCRQCGIDFSHPLHRMLKWLA